VIRLKERMEIVGKVILDFTDSRYRNNTKKENKYFDNTIKNKMNSIHLHHHHHISQKNLDIKQKEKYIQKETILLFFIGNIYVRDRSLCHD